MSTSNQDPLKLFRDDAVEAFELGASAALLQHRNPQLGNLMLAERALYYVQILYRMLISRRTHELEPLYEDIYDAVRPAQELLTDTPYTSEQFRTDLNQLASWDLVSYRIEKERIRGYKDNRKKKFRFRLLPEAISFLVWLEDRLQEDIENRNADARNQLEDFSINLTELLRLLRKFRVTNDSNEEQARRILYQLFKLEEITLAINANLGEVNARLLSFINRTYNHEELKQVILELETYLQNFLRKIDRLRRDVEPSLEQLNQDGMLNKIAVAFEVMEEERKRAPHFLRANRQSTSHRNIPGQLLKFHTTGGVLDQLCGRIHESSFLVVRKMYAYLRELERKSNRIEDIRDRLAEMIAMDEDKVPHSFMRQLISPVQMRSDPQHWNAHEKADPPKPRRPHERESGPARTYINPKKKADGPAKSMEVQQMEVLGSWLDAAVLKDGNQLLSGADFTEFADFERIIQLAKTGYLGKGRRLRRLGYTIDTQQEDVTITLDRQSLSFRDMEIVRSKDE